jgi:hypothetical protein
MSLRGQFFRPKQSPELIWDCFIARGRALHLKTLFRWLGNILEELSEWHLGMRLYGSK